MQKALVEVGLNVEVKTPPMSVGVEKGEKGCMLPGKQQNKSRKTGDTLCGIPNGVYEGEEEKTAGEGDEFCAANGKPLPWVIGKIILRPPPAVLHTTLRVDAPEFIPPAEKRTKELRRRERRNKEPTSLSMKSLPIGGSRRDPEELAAFMHLHVLQVFTYLKKLREAHAAATAAQSQIH